jgi:hypothetical protein
MIAKNEMKRPKNKALEVTIEDLRTLIVIIVKSAILVREEKY